MEGRRCSWCGGDPGTSTCGSRSHYGPRIPLSIEDRIHIALNQAVENGYLMFLVEADEATTDLMTYDSSFEDEDYAKVLPHVQSWIDSYRGKH